MNATWTPTTNVLDFSLPSSSANVEVIVILDDGDDEVVVNTVDNEDLYQYKVTDLTDDTDEDKEQPEFSTNASRRFHIKPMYRYDDEYFHNMYLLMEEQNKINEERMEAEAAAAKVRKESSKWMWW